MEYMQCMLAESLLLFLLYFVPTLGGSGAAEGRLRQFSDFLSRGTLQV